MILASEELNAFVTLFFSSYHLQRVWSVPGIFYMGESGCLIEFSVAELVIYSKKFLKSNAHVDTKQSFMIKLANLI